MLAVGEHSLAAGGDDLASKLWQLAVEALEIRALPADVALDVSDERVGRGLDCELAALGPFKEELELAVVDGRAGLDR